MTIEESTNNSYGLAVLYGVITIFSIAVVSSLIFSVILRFTSVEEASLEFIITAISFVTLFLGGFISGGKGKKKGWLVGGLTGFIYTLIILLFQYLGYDQLFTIEQLIYHICFIVTAMMGGILGVNINSSRS